MIIDFYSFVSVPASACLRVVSVTYTAVITTALCFHLHGIVSLQQLKATWRWQHQTLQCDQWSEPPASHLLPCQHRAPGTLGIGCVKSPSYGAELCKSLRFCKICAWLKKNMMWKLEASHSTLSGQMYSLPLQSIGMPMSAFINAGTQLPLEVSS